MSHLSERPEKNCLNCNAQVAGRYCQVCGQENIKPVETTWHLVTHFFNDITHFDGKFFSTLRYLLKRPGFISHEYMKGRRASYLNPVRMYVFTSAIFFLIFFSVFKVDERTISTNAKSKSNEKKIAVMDSASFAGFTAAINNGRPMSRDEYKKWTESSLKDSGIHFTSRRYKSMKEYDSVLAAGKNHNWLQRTLVRREIQLNEKYKGDQTKMLSAFVSELLHSFPQMLFVSLPLFALALQLLYIRRKQYFYTNHLIFSVHLYIFVFIVLLVIIGLNELAEHLNKTFIYWLIGLLYVMIFFYEYKAMRNFYQQRRARTILKFLLLNLLHFTIITLLFIIFTFFSFLKI